MDDNSAIAVEWNFSQQAITGLRARGHDVTVSPRFNTEFGCAQMAMKSGHGFIAASDHRKDGYPVGI